MALPWGQISLTAGLFALYLLGFWVTTRSPGEGMRRVRGGGEMPFLEHLE